MKLKKSIFLFVLLIAAAVFAFSVTSSAQNVITDPIIRSLNDNFYIDTDQGSNIYTYNGVRTYYQGTITFLGIDSEYSVFVEDGEHDIVFDSVAINSSESSPLDITSGASVSLCLKNSNLLSAKSSLLSAIHVENGASLTIWGDGKLVASGGREAACIGGNYNELISKSYCGDITIEGGEIVAKTGAYAIGHGNYSTFDVFIPSNSVDFVMTGGVLFTQPSVAYSRDRIPNLDNITITGGNTDAFNLCNELSLVGVEDCEILGFEGISYEAYGTKTIGGLIYLPYSAGIPSKIETSEGTFVRLDSSFAFLPEDEPLVVISGEDENTKLRYNFENYSTEYSLDGGKNWTIYNMNATVAFCNYSGEISFDNLSYKVILYNTNLEGSNPFVINSADVNLTLFGSNTSTADDDNHAGVQVPVGSVLTISHESTGNLEAKGDGDGAGIGGNEGKDYGTINIYGGGIRAISGSGGGGAGIGSGYEAYSEGGSITIGGRAHVYAKSEGANYWGGAGIGAGCDSGAGTIKICDNATVTAYAGPEGAGIGSSGDGGPSTCNITIEGNAYIYAEGNYGAGIGGGYKKTANIIINGGTIEAKSKNGGAGIGGGDGADSGNITINGGNIKASTTGGGAKIGCGDGGNNTCSIPTLREVEVDTTGNSTLYGNCLVFTPVDGYNWTGIRFCDSDYGKLYLYLPEDAQLPTAFSVDGRVLEWDGSKYAENTSIPLCATETVIDGVSGNFDFNYDGYALACKTESYSFDCHDTITLKNLGENSSFSFEGNGNIQVNLDNITISPTYFGEGALVMYDDTTIFLNLVGDNSLTSRYNAIGVNNGSDLVINGDGSLSAITTYSGAGIGGEMSHDTGSVVINSGTIYAEGNGTGDAGIGGGYGNSSLGDIIINGGFVTAISGGGAAGIGGGLYGTCDNDIIINGGTVSAKGRKYDDRRLGVGIGAGSGAYASPDLIINGGNIYAATDSDGEDIISAGPIRNSKGTELVKHTFSFTSLPDKTSLTATLTDEDYFTRDVVSIEDSFYFYLPEDAVVPKSAVLNETNYYYLSNDQEKQGNIHIYSTIGKTQIRSIDEDSITVIISQEVAVPESVAKLLYAVYENGSFSRLVILDCPTDKAGMIEIPLPEGLIPSAGDMIFLWNGFSSMTPLCENHIVE